MYSGILRWTGVLGWLCATATYGALVTHYDVNGTALDPAGGRNATLTNGATFSINTPGVLGGTSLNLTTDLAGNSSQLYYDVTGADSLSGSWTMSIWINSPAACSLTCNGARA